jgi:ABC-type antimicrobial peptide transport system permease subunit
MMNLVVRTHTDPESLAATVRGELRTIDKSIPALETRTMEDLIAATTSSRRFLTWLVTGFALLALLLAAGGTFAQVAYTVSQRSHEIGIRVALGASRASVVGLMMGQTLALIVCGGLLGIAATSGVARFLQQVLFAVQPLDVPTLVAAPLVMLGIAALACVLPSWRATQTDPAIGLRAE